MSRKKFYLAPLLSLFFFLLAACSSPGGTLEVTITGLPSGVDADVTVAGPGGYSQHLTSSTTLAGLAPGDYTVTANGVTSGNTTYDPDPPSQTVTVSPGKSVTAEVHYTASAHATYTLEVTVNGPGSVMSDDGRISCSENGGTCSTAYDAGATVTLRATPESGAQFDGWSGDANGTSRSVTIVMNADKSVTASFSPATGDLEVTITGLPSGVDADVTVTGPGGYSQHLTSSTTLTDLAPGDYTVTANGVAADWQTYDPAPPTQTVSVSAGTTASANVAYTEGNKALLPYASNCAGVAVNETCDVQVGLFNNPASEAYSGIQFDVVFDGFTFAEPSGASAGELTNGCVVDNGPSTVGVVCAAPFSGSGEAVVLHLVRTVDGAGFVTVENARLIREDLSEEPLEGGTLNLE